MTQKTLLILLTSFLLSFSTDHQDKDNNQEQLIIIKLPVKYVATTVGALYELPAKTSMPIIDSIVSQYNKQIK